MQKVFILLFLFVSFHSDAQHLYGLDSTFATNGIYIGDTGAVIKMAVQHDGKIVITDGERKFGQRSVAMRFHSDGSLDSSFASNGRLIVGVSKWYREPTITSLCLQPDGKVILGGCVDSSVTGDDFLLIRLKLNGTLDSSFGGGGYVMTAYTDGFIPGAVESISSIALQPDGKILAYGLFDLLDDTLLIIRYHTDGRVDSSFGMNGKVKLAYDFDYPRPNDIAVMPDGRIIVGAKADINALGGNSAFVAIRLLSNGSLDTSFNHNAVAYTNTNLGGLLYCTSMQLQSDGKVLLGGHADSLAIVRFDTTGQLDNSFGKNGLIKLDPSGKVIEMILQPDGKIVLGANPDGFPYPDTCYAVYRIMPNGKADSSFGMNGKVLTKTSNASNMLGDITLQTDGKLIVGAGFMLGGMFPPKIMLVRYLLDAPTPIQDVGLINKSSSVYPNPTASFIYVEPPPKESIQQLALYSADGKLVLTQTHPNSNRLSTEGLTDGIYYLYIRFVNQATTTQKIIIQKN